MHKSWPLCFLSFAAGIALAHYEINFIALLIMLLAGLAASCWRSGDHRMILIVIMILVGVGNYQLRTPESPEELNSHKALRIAGKIQDLPYFDGEKTSFTLSTEDTSPYRRRIRVVCLFESTFKRGDCLELCGDLKPPRQPGNPGEFDFPAYLAEQGIFYNLTVKQSSQATLTRAATGPLRWVDLFRQQAEELTRRVLSPQESAVLLGMLLGGRAGMDEEQYTDFQKTGIVHLFSVGGLHVGFLLLLVAWMCSLARVSRRLRFGAGASVLLLYGTMVGWPAPVIRAVLMGILGLLAYYSGRDNLLPNALAISGLIILLLDPGALFNLSFQLTYLATWGLVCLFPLLRSMLPQKGWVWDMLLLPIAAELAVLPLVAYHFNLFTPVSILTNILTTYLAGAAVILGFMALLSAGTLPALAALLLYPAGLFIEIILWVVQQTILLPGAYLWVGTPALVMVVLYYLGLLGAVGAWQTDARRRYMPAALALILVFLISLLLPASCYQRGSLEITFIDVGQGDAILVKSPQGKFILVDGGGSRLYDVGTRTVLPYLHHRGLRRLDMMINTHPDIDHLQGLESVARQMPVKYLGLPASVIDCPEYRDIKNTADEHQTSIVALQAGQLINLEEGLEIQVLNPQPGIYTGQQYNQESVVLQVRYGDFAALLTGDITAAVMPAVSQAATHPTLLVKVPHHGSKGSLCEEFYQSLQPRHAVISVGADNSFGHPAAPVLEMLAEEDVKIWRTDRDGAVTVKSDGVRYQVEAYL